MRVVDADVNLPKSTQDLLQLMMFCDAPFEACGVIRTGGQVEQYLNISNNPEHAFDAIVDNKTNDVDVVWHSHLNGLFYPSRDDIPMMEALTGVPRWLIVTDIGCFMYKVVGRGEPSQEA